MKERRETPGFGAWSVKAGVPHVQPPRAVLDEILTLRLHWDDCDEHNGALQVLPGSHRHGRFNAVQIREWWETVPAMICAARKGDALLLRPLLLHASTPAVHPAHRRVLHLEFAAVVLPGGLEWCDWRGVGSSPSK